jgi:F0F1-type ATP synthase assembly protein I
MLRDDLTDAYGLILLQLILILLLALGFGFYGGKREFGSVLLGGCVWLLPSIYFVRKLFAAKVQRNPQTLLKDFLVGELFKLLFSAGLIILVLYFIKIEVIAFISGYLAAITASFLLPLLYIKK